MSKTPIRDDRFRTPSLPPRGKLPAKPDNPGTAKDDIPKWMKVLVIVHVVATYGIIIAHGLDFAPFHLEAAPLTALTATGIGSSLGLVAKQITKTVGLHMLKKN